VSTVERGGVLLRVRTDEGDALGFVPADVARRLAALSTLTPVPGARPPVVGIALADGAVVTVLRIGRAGAPSQRPTSPPPRPAYEPGGDWMVPGADRALLCQLGGVEVALTGASVVATGVFDVAPGGEGVLWRSEVVPVIDVRALYAQAEAATWAERAISGGPKAGAQVSSKPPVTRGRDPSNPPVQPEDEGRHAMLPGAPAGDGEMGGGS
jgi:hypothetical protein